MPRPWPSAYADLWHRLRAAEWAAYAERAPLDRAAIDSEIFVLSSASGDASDAGGAARERTALLVRLGIDHHPEVASLQQRIEHGWGDAGAVEPDVIALIRLRRRLVEARGWPSYAHLAMAAEGLELDAVVASLTALRDRHLPAASAMAAEARLTMDEWFAGLDAFSGPAPDGASPDRLTNELAARLSCSDLLGSITLAVRDDSLAGFTAALGIPRHVRVLLRPPGSLRDVATLCHELGHAFAYAGTRARGLDAIPTDTQDETMGMVLERIGVELLLDPSAVARLADLARAEMTRTATSALFELAIEASPDSAREQYVAWHEPLAPVVDPAGWALDSFRSSDPCRVQGYALGATFGDTLLAGLRTSYGDDTSAWGNWLRESLWAPGRRDRFADLLRSAESLRPA